jgi:hypothetical protein
MYSITENIYYSQLSSVVILLQPEPNCFTSYNTRKGLCSVSLCAIVLRSPPPSHVSTSNGQRSSQLFCVHYRYQRFGETYCLRLQRYAFTLVIYCYSYGVESHKASQALRPVVMYCAFPIQSFLPSKYISLANIVILFPTTLRYCEAFQSKFCTYF